MPQPKKAPAKPAQADVARGEVAGDVTSVESHGLTLQIPAVLPFAIMRHLRGGLDVSAVIAIMEELLGPEQSETVWSAGLSLNEGTALVGDLLQASGISPGE